MPAARPPTPNVVEATAAVRRVIAARVRDQHDREDLVQTTLVRVAAAQERLEDGALQAYAIVTARHVVADHFRRETTHRHHIHRLVEYTRLDGPEELTLQREETDALATALERLDPHDRRVLLAHEVDGVPTAALAAADGGTAGGVAVRLARARARLRLEFLLVFRHIELPTDHCRAVLLALSAGERRRQLAVHASEHLLECETCADLSAPLLERRRSIAGLLPLIGLRPLFAAVGRAAKNGKVQAAVGVSAVAGVIAIGVLARPTPARAPAKVVTAPAAHRRPAKPLASPLMSGRDALLPLPTDLAAFAGHTVAAHRVDVLSVPANEGAWVGTDAKNHIWVEFIGPGESPFHLVAGQHLTFSGKLLRNPPEYSEAVGLPAGLDASELDRMGLHIEANYNAVHISR